METRHYKLVLLGDSGVGKSSVVTRAVHDEFHGPQGSTIGAAFFTHVINVPSGYVHLDIWDTAGQERYRSLAPMYYRNSHVALVVLDLTSRASFESAKRWIQDCRDHARTVVLISNKVDAVDSECDFRDAVQQYARQTGIEHHEVSAKTGLNVASVFHDIANKLWNERPQHESALTTTPFVVVSERSRKHFCCG